MNKEQAIEILKTDSCYECTYGCRSPITCGAEICPLKQATQVAIDSLDNEWVDVRDRLPNKEDWYLTTHEHGEVILHYFTFTGKQFVYNHPLEAERRTPVIAWKPLPQPYKRKE